MKYTLNKKIDISGPIIFLCGPYFEKNNPSDRRNILREKISEIYDRNKQKVLPLIVDPFFSSEKIDYKVYNVQLLEEICAAVSCQTHIFLDTMSAATELGLFANSAYSNKISVYIPKKTDISNKGNVGFFVREAVINRPDTKISVIEYRPRLIRCAYSSTFSEEHYFFNNDDIPQNILIELENEALKNFNNCHFELLIRKTTESPKINEICYSIENNVLYIKPSLRLLFYTVASIIHQEYLTEKGNILLKISLMNMLEIENNVKEAMQNFVLFETGIFKKRFMKIDIVSELKNDVSEVIGHVIEFIRVYYMDSSMNKNMSLITSKDSITTKIKICKHPFELFDLTDEEFFLVNEIKSDVTKFFEKTYIVSGKKKREIIKYQDNKNGERARKLHQHLNSLFRKKYIHSEHSFAYHKESSIQKCVYRHIKSNSFIKLDIKNFFASIPKDILIAKLSKDFDIDEHYEWILENIISSCFFDNRMPLGLVTSPIFSDYYLNDFDKKIGDYCKKENFVYTRYADDILISAQTLIDISMREQVITLITEMLSGLFLRINEEKTQYIDFDNNHQFMRYIGINLVHSDAGNYLSVGRYYIYELAKDYLNYVDLQQQKTNNTEEGSKLENKLFYSRYEIIGKIAFIKQVEGKRGVERLQQRLNKYYPEINLEAL